MCVLMKSPMSSKMVYVGSEKRSQGQILEKPCVCSRGQIFSPIIMKLGQNVFIDKILDMFKNGSFRSKTRSNLLKNLVYTLEATFSVRLSLKLVRIFVSMKSLKSLKMDHIGSKTRSLGQTLEKPCVCSRDQTFSLILMKLLQSFCLDETLYIFENGSYWVKN